jgi:hypothetical protein
MDFMFPRFVTVEIQLIGLVGENPSRISGCKSRGNGFVINRKQPKNKSVFNNLTDLNLPVVVLCGLSSSSFKFTDQAIILFYYAKRLLQNSIKLKTGAEINNAIKVK